MTADPLRPQTLADYVGQEQAVERLSIAVAAAKRRGEPLGHILLSGPPGLGKTTLARIVADEMGHECRCFAAPALKQPGDLVGIVTSLKAGDVLFVDEIHRLPTIAEELLYSAMEEFRFDISAGKNGGARTVRVNLPKFTLVGATTRAGELSAPFRNRFKLQLQLSPYSPDELQKMLEAVVVRGRLAADRRALGFISDRSRGTPRIAIRLFDVSRDHADSRGGNTVELDDAIEAMRMEAVDPLGLDVLDRRYLDALVSRFKGGPAGVDALAAALDECRDTLEDAVEPYLTRLSMVSRTPRGRMALPLAYSHLGMAVPA